MRLFLHDIHDVSYIYDFLGKYYLRKIFLLLKQFWLSCYCIEIYSQTSLIGSFAAPVEHCNVKNLLHNYIFAMYDLQLLLHVLYA